MIPNCSICDRRILRHSRHLICFACTNHVHLACLSDVSVNESIYTERAYNSWLCTFCTNSVFPFNHLEEAAYLSAIHELKTNKWTPFNNLLEYQLNPFELNDDEYHLPLFDTDPDLQYFNDTTFINTIMKCDYFLEESFIKTCEVNKVSSNAMSIIHFNIRSLVKNLDYFKSYLSTLKHEFSFIGLTETWLTRQNADLYNIEGYKHVNLCREEKRGGGISLFISDRINVAVRQDLSLMESHIEILFIEVQKEFNGTNKDCLIAVVYRPPNTDLGAFNNSLTQILQNLNMQNKDVYIMGDFNVNILDTKNHIPSEEFIENFYSFGLFPLINKPTRVTCNTATLIDNVFTNVLSDSNMLNGIFYTDISDHFPVFCININKNFAMPIVIQKYRNLNSKNIDKFRNMFETNTFEDIISMSDGKLAFNVFYRRFCNLYDECFPLKSIKSRYEHKYQWLTDGLKQSIKIKNQLYIRSVKNHNSEDVNQYKVYKRNLRKLLRINERKLYAGLLESNKSNLKKLWVIIKDVINKKRSTTIPNKFKISDEIVTDKTVIAEKFNKYFVNIGRQLASNIVPNNIDPLSFLPKVINECIFLNPVDNKLKRIIITLKKCKSRMGWDSCQNYQEYFPNIYKTFSSHNESFNLSGLFS